MEGDVFGKKPAADEKTCKKGLAGLAGRKIYRIHDTILLEIDGETASYVRLLFSRAKICEPIVRNSG